MQNVVADPAEMLGVDGIALTTADVVAAVLVHPFTVTVTLYVPVAATVALEIEGFCADDAKLSGPVHAYVAPATVLAVKLSVDPAHTGPLLPAVGALGIALTVTVALPDALAEHVGAL